MCEVGKWEWFEWYKWLKKYEKWEKLYLKIEKRNYNQTVIKSTFVVFLSLKVKNQQIFK